MRRGLVLLTFIAAGCSGSSPTAPSPAPAPVVTPAPIVPPAPVLPVRDPARFSQTFWDQFVHNTLDQPVYPLARLTSAPRLYLKTVDEAGQPIDAVTLQTTEDALQSVASTWGGGQVGLAGIERGTSTQAGQPGWLTVIWPNPSAGAFCGLATVGADGGVIKLNYLRTDVSCRCASGARMPPRIIKHELGHAFGYWHTDSDGDVMKNGVSGCADASPSAREVYHAQLAYQTPLGTASMLARAPLTIVD